MTRRFQFSLRALLGLAVLVCLVLGGWHLLVRYGQFVEILPAVANEPLRVKGRFIVFSTAETQRYWVSVVQHRRDASFVAAIAKRSVPFIYHFDDEAGPGLKSGKYVVNGYPNVRPSPAVSYTLILRAKR